MVARGMELRRSSDLHGPRPPTRNSSPPSFDPLEAVPPGRQTSLQAPSPPSNLLPLLHAGLSFLVISSNGQSAKTLRLVPLAFFENLHSTPSSSSSPTQVPPMSPAPFLAISVSFSEPLSLLSSDYSSSRCTLLPVSPGDEPHAHASFHHARIR